MVFILTWNHGLSRSHAKYHLGQRRGSLVLTMDNGHRRRVIVVSRLTWHRSPTIDAGRRSIPEVVETGSGSSVGGGALRDRARPINAAAAPAAGRREATCEQMSAETRTGDDVVSK